MKLNFSIQRYFDKLKLYLIIAMTVGIQACAHQQKPSFENKTLKEKSLSSSVVLPDKASPTSSIAPSGVIQQNSYQIYDSKIGRIPILSDSGFTTEDDIDRRAPKLPDTVIDIEVNAPVKLPHLIDIVFGRGGIAVPYVTGPKVVDRKDMISLNTSGEISAKDLFSLTQNALEKYGIKVVPQNGSYHIIEDATLRAEMPKFIRSRARVSMPNDLRPLIQFVELQAVDAGSMASFLRQAFGKNNKNLVISGNNVNNYISLTGLPVDVDAAVAIIRELDELRYAGTEIHRFSPKYWSAEELGAELERMLTIEGWSVTSRPGETRHVFIIPVAYSNDLFVFTKSATAARRVKDWFDEFDRPVEGGETEQIYVYQVKNVDAVILAEIANSVIDSSNDRNNSARPRSSLTESTDDPTANIGSNSRANDDAVVSYGAFNVDPLGNRIIFSGTVTEYEKLNRLLETLDTPAPEVLIEVQIAEVTLTENSNVGIEWFIDDIGNEDVNLTAQTIGGLNQGSAGLTVNLLSGNVEAALNAFANNRNVKLLSTPILTARSGGSASIQVGTDVPIITAQRAANNQTGSGPTDILQNIEYRSTGVLLTMEPIVFSDDRIDLNITQEVSATLDTGGDIASPTISNRSINTQLSLEDGATAVLGGLIQDNYIVDDTGIPLLKDIPYLGQLFSVDSVSLDRTELVVLITAYVLRGQDDKDRFVEALSRNIDQSISNEERLVTLKPKHF